jgi:hypothetical protein
MRHGKNARATLLLAHGQSEGEQVQRMEEAVGSLEMHSHRHDFIFQYE